MKMKQFNLNEYLKDPSQKVITRDGRDVRIICTDYKRDQPIIALVTTNTKEDVHFFYKNGRWSNTNEWDLDLFFALDKKEYFDPKTLQPFDRVLVRNFKAYKWKCEHFSYFKENDDYPCMCFSNSYAFCIPYNDETKHLLGTEDEAPEYYRYWED